MVLYSSESHAPSDTGTGARWAGSGWNTPLTCPMGGFPYRLAGRDPGSGSHPLDGTHLQS